MDETIFGTHIEIIMERRPTGEVFYVHAVDRELGAVCLLETTEYELAILLSEEARNEFGPIIDRVTDNEPPLSPLLSGD